MQQIKKNQLLIINNNNYNSGYTDTNLELRNYTNTFPFVFTKNNNWRSETIDYILSGSILQKYQYFQSKNILETSESITDQKPDSLIFYPTRDQTDFSFENALSNIDSYIHRVSSRPNSTNQLSAEAHGYYREAINAASTTSLPTVTYGLYDYIWKEDNVLNFSNIGKYPIENLTPIELTVEGDDFDILDSNTFMKSNFFTKNIVHLPQDQITKAIEANSNQVVKMWDLKNLYRGTTPTQYNLVSKKISAFPKGYKIALAKMKLKVFCPTTFEKIDSYYYFYITNIPLANYNKYSKARRFFQFVIDKSNSYDGSYFFNKELFDKKMKERFGTNTMYSNMLGKIFENTSFELNQLKMNTNTQETTFDPSIFSVYTSVKKAKNNPIYSSYTKTKSKLEEFETKVNDLSSVQSTIDSTISRLKSRIENYEQEIKSLNDNLKEREKTKKEITVNLPNYIKAKESLTEKIKKQEKEYNEYLTTISESAILEENSYAKNFKKQGIVIDKVDYIENGVTKTLEKDHKVILSSLKTNSDIKFKTVYFRTLKPVTIYVDRAEKGESCRKIIGGPYSIRVDESNLYISLLSSASAFGFDFNSKSLWAHPHTPALNTHNCSNPQSFFDLILNSERRACLGEASPAIFAAFKQKDIRQIIIAAMSWVTNANSTDAWGKNQKYFQTIDELKDSSTMITTEFVKNQNIVNQLQDPEEIFNLFSDSLEEEQQQIQEEEENQLNQNQETELPQINFSLRRPGVPNYRPYNQNQETNNNET